MADNNDTPAAEWTKERVERGIYRRESPEGDLKFLVQVRTKPGNASATFARVGEARKWRAKVLEEMRQNRRKQAGHIEIAGIQSLPGATARNELRIAVHTVHFAD